MKPAFYIILASLLVSGCATFSQMFINSSGQLVRCGSAGSGLVGMVAASKVHGDCVADMKLAGYIELEDAGAVGLQFSESILHDSLITILKVFPKSPADSIGIRSGEILYSIDSQRVKTVHDAMTLLFGRRGTLVTLQILRDTLATCVVQRASYTVVFGDVRK